MACVNAPHSVNEVVPPSAVVPTALEWARSIIANSPDAVTATKRALIVAQQAGGSAGSGPGRFEEATVGAVLSPESQRAYGGENIKVSRLGVCFRFRFIFVTCVLTLCIYNLGRAQGIYRGEVRWRLHQMNCLYYGVLYPETKAYMEEPCQVIAHWGIDMALLSVWGLGF